ncbi:murein hydrolase activator EnvC family protein [Sulfitobacter geojensis]|uniref:Peptidoglycan DD-metalloendopeptidase family protein n=1 Tax=Sulfitobacter geojensis TaxID=1342299 RepID=A0AAE3B6H4_9RHOB|nr:peptidoglycan DD-metalloendopeptidase family protein [Sulfitobacter geojensis]MBM1689673.1 peptidoglycan DD-metalloendopeptidase family protein [Sulfitobacter geojensis]MBM1693739.1 peptidoglycan DD-metalloendopeptidase family protein [Sulfitobacter geojensis]MBM1705905.1 peptidoglycan DD-metalloendopeptidase family protein [Sulfitobacter geojensis]MBM1709963.1 peptidoglycan DD-metalloendopeptidase family protein [Sulfitobacter geojensis]MBM1714029.1 peptidoglycan DD-metalloendopeptidase fa
MIRFAVILALLWPVAVAAQSIEEQARAAVSALESASTMLDQAEGARDRVRALTQTIQAFETGLGAMRAGLRQAAINEAQLTAKLASRDTEVAELLGVLQSMGGAPSPVILLHPEGPMGTARAGMLLAELTPALNRQADALRQDLENVQTLRALQADAAKRLQTGLTEVQSARTALNQAMAERTDLPKRFTADPVRTGILIASTETLDGFASGLSEIVTNETEPARATLDGKIGDLPLPVQGLVLRRAGEADAAGVKRPGLILATRPGAIVTSPTAATIRYTGGLLDFGNVVILEPQANALFVIAGLDVVYGEAGQVIAGGTPIGLMGGATAEIGEELSPLREGSGTERSETLYIEVREDNTPQDPELWFRTDEDG